jgi:ubiquinone/menaquinone biosynthesis C-methylase UbiE
MRKSGRARKDWSETKKSDSSWENWQTKLGIFQEWRKVRHNQLIRAWWAYLCSVFFHEISLLPSSGGLCLDIGCGYGGYLCKLVEEGKYEGIGLDPLKSPLKLCKDNLRRSPISKKVELIQGVGEFLPLKEECIQLSMIAGSLDHVNNPSQTLREFRRVLTPNGHLMILESVLVRKKSSFFDETHVHQFILADLKGLLRQFSIRKILRKVPIFSQMRVPDRLLAYSYLHRILSKMPGAIGRYFNYSEVLIECKKN